MTGITERSSRLYETLKSTLAVAIVSSGDVIFLENENTVLSRSPRVHAFGHIIADATNRSQCDNGAVAPKLEHSDHIFLAKVNLLAFRALSGAVNFDTEFRNARLRQCSCENSISFDLHWS